MISLHIGTDDQFVRLREILTDADYTESSVCRRLGLKKISDYDFVDREPGDPFDLLERLFMAGVDLPARQVLAGFGPAGVQLMTELGLLSGSGQTCFGTVMLYPCNSLWIVSDRFSSPTGESSGPLEDAVYPAVVENTQAFLAGLPETSCDALLDICAGSGVAALAGARYSRHTWALDISTRAAEFAEFNRRLNGIANMTSLQGDLYEPVRDQTFDRIVAHPPYVPASHTKYVYRDGGEDGEQITRRIIEGLPRYLRPTGRCYCNAMATDREGESLEQRIRKWLGKDADEFDVVLASQELLNPSDLVARMAVNPTMTAEMAKNCREMLRALHVKTIFKGFMIIQRKAGDRPAFTTRRSFGNCDTRSALEWLLAWETAASTADLVDRLLESRPRASRNLRFMVEHQLVDGQLTPVSYALEINTPFRVRCESAPWMGMLVARADGTLTLREHLSELKERNLLSSESSEQEFAGAVKTLIAGGFFEIEDFRMPQAAG